MLLDEILFWFIFVGYPVVFALGGILGYFIGQPDPLYKEYMVMEAEAELASAHDTNSILKAENESLRWSLIDEEIKAITMPK